MNLKFEFSERAVDELSWYTEYYLEIFPEGKEKGFLKLEETIVLILEFPEIGVPVLNSEFRERQISKTKFSIIYEYRKKEKVIWILSIWDGRRSPYFKITYI